MKAFVDIFMHFVYHTYVTLSNHLIDIDILESNLRFYEMMNEMYQIESMKTYYLFF